MRQFIRSALVLAFALTVAEGSTMAQPQKKKSEWTEKVTVKVWMEGKKDDKKRINIEPGFMPAKENVDATRMKTKRSEKEEEIIVVRGLVVAMQPTPKSEITDATGAVYTVKKVTNPKGVYFYCWVELTKPGKKPDDK